MNTLTITLSDAQKEFVSREVAEGKYASPEELIRHLLDEAQKRKAHERVEELLLEGLNSGDPIPVTAEYWEEKHLRVEELLLEGLASPSKEMTTEDWDELHRQVRERRTGKGES